MTIVRFEKAGRPQMPPVREQPEGTVIRSLTFPDNVWVVGCGRHEGAQVRVGVGISGTAGYANPGYREYEVIGRIVVSD